MLISAILFCLAMDISNQRAEPSKPKARAVARRKSPLERHTIVLASGKKFALALTREYDIKVVAQGLRRVRFLAWSPEHRLFVTDLYNRTDNEKGVVYFFDEVHPDGSLGEAKPSHRPAKSK